MSQTPDITDCFTWNGSRYRATSYIKKATVKLSPLMARILDKTHVVREVFCGRDEAERVCGAGVAGCDAPISEITDVCPVEGWTVEMIWDSIASAMSLVGVEAD